MDWLTEITRQVELVEVKLDDFLTTCFKLQSEGVTMTYNRYIEITDLIDRLHAISDQLGNSKIVVNGERVDVTKTIAQAVMEIGKETFDDD